MTSLPEAEVPKTGFSHVSAACSVRPEVICSVMPLNPTLNIQRTVQHYAKYVHQYDTSHYVLNETINVKKKTSYIRNY